MFAGGMRTLEKGNSERVAEYDHKAARANIFTVKTRKTYAAAYTASFKEAQPELHRGSRLSSQERPRLLRHRFCE